MKTNWHFSRGMAASLVAAVAWPGENPALRDEWAPKMLSDSELRDRTIEKARSRFDAAIRAVLDQSAGARTPNLDTRTDGAGGIYTIVTPNVPASDV